MGFEGACRFALRSPTTSGIVGREDAWVWPRFQMDRDAKSSHGETIKSSAIEGVKLDPENVRSSLARRLGLEVGGLTAHKDRNVDGVVEMMLDATQKFSKPLTRERLFEWHAHLFPGVRTTRDKFRVGAWRDDNQGPMQVVSGPVGRHKVHYEAP